MTKLPKPGFTASQALGAVLLAGYVLMLASNLPGHLSYDSLAQLREGRLDVRETWGPVLYAWILGAFDEVVPGTGLYVAASGFLLTGSLLSFRGLRRKVSWAAVVFAVLMVLSPILLVYQGIVWKDVLFANLAVAGFACLARAVLVWDRPRRPWFALAGAMLAFAVAAQTRQNGLIVIVFAAMALAWAARNRGWRSSAVWGIGGLVITVALSSALAMITAPPQDGPDQGMSRGFRIIAHYDIVGAVVAKPGLPLDQIAAADPMTERMIRTRAAGLYSPERVDYMGQDPEIGRLWGLSDEVVYGQWRAIVLGHPGSYLEHRVAVFREVLATPRIDSCLPVYVGVTGPEPLIQSLEITPAVEPQDRALYNYTTWFLDTPVFSHLFYALIALAAAAALVRRGEDVDLVIAAMLLSALAFAASFALISIACDYRYIYFLDVAALAGALYLVIEPPLGRPRRWRHRAREAA